MKWKIVFVSQCFRKHADIGCGVASLMMLLKHRDEAFSRSYNELADALRITDSVRKKWGEQYDGEGFGAYPADITKFLKEERIPFIQIHRGGSAPLQLMRVLETGPLMIGMSGEEWGEYGHWIVLESKYRSGYYYLDPHESPTGSYRKFIAEDMLLRDWDGFAIQLLR